LLPNGSILPLDIINRPNTRPFTVKILNNPVIKYQKGVFSIEFVIFVQNSTKNGIFRPKYTECSQCATSKLPKKVLHIGDIALFLFILKNKGQFMVNNGRIF